MKKLFEIEYPEPQVQINEYELDCCLKSKIHLVPGYREGVSVREVTFVMLEAEEEEANAEWAKRMAVEAEQEGEYMDAEYVAVLDLAALEDTGRRAGEEAKEQSHEFKFLSLDLNVQASALPVLKLAAIDILREICDIEAAAVIDEWDIELC